MASILATFGPAAIGLLLIAAVSQAADPPAYPLTQCAAPSKDYIKLVEDGRSIRNLYHRSRGAWVNVTRFRNPHHIFEYGTSPDGRYLLAWLMDFSLGNRVMDVSPSGRYLATFPVAWVGDQEIAVYDLYGTSAGSGLIPTTPIWTVGSVGQVDRIDWFQEQRVVMHYVAADDLTATEKKQISLDLHSRGGRR